MALHRKSGWARLAGLPLIALLITACSDSTEPETVDISELAAQLSRINSGVILADKTSASALELWRVITPVMADKGGVAPPGSGTPGPAAASPLAVQELPPIVQALGKHRSQKSLFGGMAAPPVPPLGISCDWNVETDKWKGAGDRIGLPSPDAIRFELYNALGGMPTTPLDPIGTVIDVRPGTQGSTGSSVLDVKLTGGTPENSGGGVLDVLLTGNWKTSELNLLMGGFVSAEGGRLDYSFRIDQTVATNDMQVEDLVLRNQVTADFSNRATGNIQINKGTVSAVGSLEFDYEFDRNTFAIIGGTVEVNGSEVATMGGSALAPIFTITSTMLENSDRAHLTSIFVDSGSMDQRITELWAWGYCLGADDAGACTLSAALLPG